MSESFNPKFGQVVQIPFTLTNATTGLSNSDLVAAGGAGTGWVAPDSGSVVGIGVRAAAAITAGTVTVQGHKASTELTETAAPSVVCNATNQATYARIAPGAITFAAGDVLGLSATTTTTLDPTNTLDVEGWLYVALNPS